MRNILLTWFALLFIPLGMVGPGQDPNLYATIVLVTGSVSVLLQYPIDWAIKKFDELSEFYSDPEIVKEINEMRNKAYDDLKNKHN